jgi:hypothetical protein
MSHTSPNFGMKAAHLAEALAKWYEAEAGETKNKVWASTCRIRAGAFREILHAMKTGESVLGMKRKGTK